LVRYEGGDSNVRSVVENYQLSPTTVRVTAEVEGDAQSLRVSFPALVFDGLNTNHVVITGAVATEMTARLSPLNLQPTRN
jgi:hypothetical protein